jgi:molybdenum cofactor cytidylyltransferase
MICGILLAAGNGSRFGSDKLLHPLPDGTPLGIAAARNLARGVDRAVAVVKPESEVLASLLREAGLEVQFCPDAHRGMGASLACGVRAAPDAGGWLVALADMPSIRPDTIRRVAALIDEGAALAAPVYQYRNGHPIGFGREFFLDLVGGDGDRGPRHLLIAHSARLRLHNCDDPGVLTDIDTPKDLFTFAGAAGSPR